MTLIFCANPSSMLGYFSGYSHFGLLVVLEQRSGDHQSQWASSSGGILPTSQVRWDILLDTVSEMFGLLVVRDEEIWDHFILLASSAGVHECLNLMTIHSIVVKIFQSGPK